MTIEFNPKKVANLLKQIVNQSCEDGFLWYPNIGEMPIDRVQVVVDAGFCEVIE